MAKYRIGFDTGGTFTDFTFIDDHGSINVTKVPSTPKDPSQAIINGINKIGKEYQVSPESITYLVHGTTVATNTLLQHNGARTGLITTGGFRDVLEIGRQNRPKLYDLFQEKPAPIIPRKWRREVSERIDAKGRVVRPLAEEECLEIARFFKREGVVSIAVCLLHSYLNSGHEQAIKEIIKREYPEAFVSLSSEVCPQFREYERTSTTAINAYVMPVVSNYLSHLESKLEESIVRQKLHVMQSNGGIMGSDIARNKAAHTSLSGPAAGVIASVYVCGMAGYRNLISMDMGGTSCDVSLIDGGTPKLTTDGKIEDYPLNIPMIEINTIGAGGGSIARIDEGGAMQVGPMSAGADPGPACYGNDGLDPTVTDANLVLGRLNPDYFLGGEVRLNRDLAEKAIRDRLCGPLKMDLASAAGGIVKIADSLMVKAIRLISISRGYNPKDFALVAFGGAGPLHAAAVARELNIPTVIVPKNAGVFSALGLLVADIQHDYVLTRVREAGKTSSDELGAEFGSLEDHGIQTLRNEGISPADIKFKRFMDMRYLGQAFEISVPLGDGEINAKTLESLVSDFNEYHKNLYGFNAPGEPVEFVTMRVTVSGESKKPALPEIPQCSENTVKEALKGHRKVYLEDGFVEAGVYDRHMLLSGARIEGPAVIEEKQSTTVIFPGQKVEIDRYGNLIISI